MAGQGSAPFQARLSEGLTFAIFSCNPEMRAGAGLPLRMLGLGSVDADTSRGPRSVVRVIVSRVFVAAKAAIGVISEADLMRREEIGSQKTRPWWLEEMTPGVTLAKEFAQSHGKRVEELMSSQVISPTEDASLSEIASLLERHRVKRVPILKDGKLVGIVSRSNLVQGLASAKSDGARGGEKDHMIRAEIVSRLAEQHWTDFGDRNIIVMEGVAHIWGLVGSPSERKALIALAEGVPGVTDVRDEMIATYE